MAGFHSYLITMPPLNNLFQNISFWLELTSNYNTISFHSKKGILAELIMYSKYQWQLLEVFYPTFEVFEVCVESTYCAGSSYVC